MFNQSLPYAFIKEAIEKQNRNSEFLHYTDFRTNLNKVPITTKFYSKYDSQVENVEKNEKYMEKVAETLSKTVHEKYTEPIMESHKYGWIKEPFMKYDERDTELLNHPRNSSDITRVGEKIAAEKVTQRPKWAGLPFKLS